VGDDSKADSVSSMSRQSGEWSSDRAGKLNQTDLRYCALEMHGAIVLGEKETEISN